MRDRIINLLRLGAMLAIIITFIEGCLPDKKEGFSCIAAPLLSKIKLPTVQPAIQQSQPSQPADFKAEEAKINKVLDKLCAAFNAKDVEGSLACFHESERNKYRKMLSDNIDRLPELAIDLRKAKISHLSFETQGQSRRAEYIVPAGNTSVPIIFIKIEGQWLIKIL